MENVTIDRVKALTDLGFRVSSDFVPFSVSRNAKEKLRSLNWFTTLYYKNRPIWRGDYMQGQAHCPSYRQWDNSIDTQNNVNKECER